MSRGLGLVVLVAVLALTTAVIVRPSPAPACTPGVVDGGVAGDRAPAKKRSIERISILPAFGAVRATGPAPCVAPERAAMAAGERVAILRTDAPAQQCSEPPTRRPTVRGPPAT
jgi:hypothetical protein